MLSFPGILWAEKKSEDTVLDVRLLESRIEDFYRSLASQDFARLLEVLSPVTRACEKAADLERDSGFKIREGDQLKSWRIGTIKSVPSSEGEQEVECAGRHYKAAAAAEVTMVVKSRSAGTSRSAEHKDEWVYVDGQWYWQSYAGFEADEPRWFANQDSSESSGNASGASVAVWRTDNLIGFSLGETNGVMYRHLIEEGFAFEAGLGWSIIGEDALQVHATFLGIGDALYVGVGARVKFEDDIHFGLRFPLGLQTESRWPHVFLEAAPLVDLDPHFAVHLSVTAGMRW